MNRCSEAGKVTLQMSSQTRKQSEKKRQQPTCLEAVVCRCCCSPFWGTVVQL